MLPVVFVLLGGVANELGLSSEFSATVPIPAAVRPKKWRRVSINSDSRSGCMTLLILTFGEGFTEVKQQVSDHRPRAHFADIKRFVTR